MDAREHLYQTKAEYDLRVDAILSDLGCSAAASLDRHIRCLQAALQYANALGEAAPRERPELGEAYRETAKETMSRVTHFLSFIDEYRNRHEPSA